MCIENVRETKLICSRALTQMAGHTAMRTNYYYYLSNDTNQRKMSDGHLSASPRHMHVRFVYIIINKFHQRAVASRIVVHQHHASRSKYKNRFVRQMANRRRSFRSVMNSLNFFC